MCFWYVFMIKTWPLWSKCTFGPEQWKWFRRAIEFQRSWLVIVLACIVYHLKSLYCLCLNRTFTFNSWLSFHTIIFVSIVSSVRKSAESKTHEKRFPLTQFLLGVRLMKLYFKKRLWPLHNFRNNTFSITPRLRQNSHSQWFASMPTKNHEKILRIIVNP